MEVRVKFVAALILILFGCERQTPVDESPGTEGYRIQGRITDGLGNSLVGVKVKLYYDFYFIDGNPAPSTTYDVTNSVQVIRVTVNDRDNNVVRTLYNGTHSTGTMRVDWNRKDLQGNDMPSSVYTIQYWVDNQLKKSYPVTVNGTVTAVSDSLGAYVIPDKFLPVGFYPVPTYSSDSSKYYGQYQVAGNVGLDFVTPIRTKTAFVTLTKGFVSQVDIVFN